MDTITSQFQPGSRVCYQPHHSLPPEYGIVTSLNQHFVFVNFDNELHSKACMHRDLKLKAEFISTEGVTHRLLVEARNRTFRDVGLDELKEFSRIRPRPEIASATELIALWIPHDD